MPNDKSLRVVDANFNRCKEGLRVIEDVFRFVMVNDTLRKKIRKMRHSLDILVQEKTLKDAVLSRNSKNDIGKLIDSLEIKRNDPCEILYVNFQRVKESLRVLEEFLKVILPKHVAHIKKLRYGIYTLEKKTLKLWPSVCNSRQKSNWRGKSWYSILDR